MTHHLSATREQQALILEAEDRGFDAGREVGWNEGKDAVADWLERKGYGELAKELRAMKVKTESGE